MGRTFRGSRRVRLGDVDRHGRLRLDALARYLQDVSDDDTRDARLPDAMAWVVRRTVVEVTRPPVFAESLDLVTFCGGVGSRWAERRVSAVGTEGGCAHASTLWVHLDTATGRPQRLSAAFHERFAAAAQGRSVPARLVHEGPPSGAHRRSWTVRATDVDVFGHVNNAAAWAVLEELLASRADLRRALRAEAEFPAPLDHDGHGELVVELRWTDGGPGEALCAWLVRDGVVTTSFSAVPLDPDPGAA